MTEFIVQKQITIDASKSSVWQMLTNPDLTEKYFFGCRIDSNFTVGDPIIFKRMILWIFPFELKGNVLDVDRGNMLKYSLKNSKSVSESIVTIRLQENGGKTIVSVTDDVGQGDGVEQRYTRSVKGWDKVLNGMKRVAEKL